MFKTPRIKAAQFKRRVLQHLQHLRFCFFSTPQKPNVVKQES